MGVHLPIADTVYNVLWQHLPAAKAFNKIENILT
jgi:hypothetical protein